MADSKITALTSIGASTDPANDPLVLVDVSDTSMAASGTTKKVTLNQLLGASGTATLASATISGDLTVDTSTLKVDSANNYVGIGTASPVQSLTISGEASVRVGDLFYWNGYYNAGFKARAAGYAAYISEDGSGDFTIANTASSAAGAGSSLSFLTRHRITNAGVCTWENVGGVAGTAMTLNSTGLGVGVTPAANSALTILKSNSSAALKITNGPSSNNCGITLESLGGNVVLNNGNGPLEISVGGSLRATVDVSGNVGVGVTPSAWNSNYNAFDIGQNGTIAGRAGSSNTVDIASNGFRNTSGNWVYKLATSNTACRYQIDGSTGSHIWYTGAAGTAGNTISGFSSALMTLDASGNLIWSPASSPPSLATNGQLTVNATSNTNLRFSYRGSDGVTRVANLTLA